MIPKSQCRVGLMLYDTAAKAPQEPTPDTEPPDTGGLTASEPVESG